MNRIWDQVLQTVMTGTERHPLSADLLNRLGVPPSDNPIESAQAALIAAWLQRKAGAPLLSAPPTLPETCPPDERPLCPPDALRDLQALLRGSFPGVLPEFFQLLADHDLRLPPEYLPQVLDVLARRKEITADRLSVLGPLAGWLISQNPAWGEGPAPEVIDWDTAPFPERLRLLERERLRDPLAAGARLEKTWPTERVEHKVRFLEALRTGLSRADEPLLMRAVGDKQIRVRYPALRLLLLLPESAVRTESRNLLLNLGSAKQLPDFLETALPETGLLSRMQLAALAPALPFRYDNSGAAAAWLSLIAPSDLIRPDRPVEHFLDVLVDGPLFEALLSGIAWHADIDAAIASLIFLDARPEHSCWHSAVAAEVAATVPMARKLPLLIRLCGHENLLERPDSALVRTLMQLQAPWPRALWESLLNYPIRSAQPQYWQAPEHLLQLLQKAALACVPSEAEDVQEPNGRLPYAWHHQLLQFRAAAGFRRRLHDHFKTGANSF